jgi:membrane associated rhomboid family serine protease
VPRLPSIDARAGRPPVIPLRDRNPTTHVPVITIALIAINVVVYLFWQPSISPQPGEQDLFYFCHAEIPYEVTHQTNLASAGVGGRAAIAELYGSNAGAIQALLRQECPDKSWLASVFVAMFLHGGILHIAGNMLFLWVFGNNVEDRLGYLVYPLFYLLGGIAAAALQIAFDPNSAVPNLGASGAIGAVLGAYLVLFPRARVTTLVIFFFITAAEIPASILLIGWFLLQVFSGGSALGSGASGGVAYWAHVGGFAFGAIVAWLFYRPKRVEPRWGSDVPGRPDVF